MKSIELPAITDAEGRILPNLVSNQGENNIGEIIQYIRAKIEEKGPKRNQPLNINQLRKFYDSFLKIYNTSVAEKEKKIQLLMLKANVEYSAKRLHTNRFKEFFSNRVDIVSKHTGINFLNNLKALKLHLEALVAYFPKD